VHGQSRKFTTKIDSYIFKPDIDLSKFGDYKFKDILLGKIPKGKELEMIEFDTIQYIFYKVKFKNKIGYIHKNFIIDDYGIIDRAKKTRDSINYVIDFTRRQDSILRVRAEIKRQDSIRLVAKNKKDRDRFINDSIIKQRIIEFEQAHERDKSLLVKAGKPIEIDYCYSSQPNSAGGVDLFLKIKNISNKEIKYLWITGYVINDVGDKEYCRIRRQSLITARAVGPIKSNQYESMGWDCLWYNYSIGEFIPTQIKLQYMDNSIVLLAQSKIKSIIEAELLDKRYNIEDLILKLTAPK